MEKGQKLPAPDFCNREGGGKANPIPGMGALGNQYSGRMYYTGSGKEDHVTLVQMMLTDLGYDVGSKGPDGKFGNDTEKAVKEFQKAHEDWGGEKLNVDGLVGPETADALNRAMVEVEGWYDQHQTDKELTVEFALLTVRAEALTSPVSIDVDAVTKAKVIIAGEISGITQAVWSAAWDRPKEPARWGDQRDMILTAPGLSANTPVVFTVMQKCKDKTVKVSEVEAVSTDGSAKAAFGDWFHREQVTSFVQLKEDDPDNFPQVLFRFEVKHGSHHTKSSELLYNDHIEAHLFSGSGDERKELSQTLCTVYSPWGQYESRTDDQGFLKIEELPPGGVSLGIGGQIIHLKPE
jgi:hypothetical protein